jgi:enoyl-CoA hydratase
MALTGDPISAEVAYEFGLVVGVVEEGMALDAAIDLARRIALNAPLSIEASRQLVRAAIGQTEEEFFLFQRSIQARVFSSKDAKEGPRAFAEKRRPLWTGT